MVRADSDGSGSSNTPSILSKAFDVLRAFDSAHRVMTLSELARASGLPKSTVHRLLSRLIELGAVEHHGASGYKIGLNLVQIGGAAPALSMRDVAMPYMTSLQRWSGQAVYLGVLRQFDVVCLERLEPPHIETPPVLLGGRLPANCTALGKTLLAHEDFDDLALFLPSPLPALTPRSIVSVDELIAQLRQVHRLGVAQERGETRTGLDCIASPIVVRDVAVGALSIAYPSSVPLDPKAPTALREAATALARRIRERVAGNRMHWFPGPS